MKKLITISSALILFLMFSQCGPTSEQAMEYNDKLITDQLAVINAINDVDNAFTTYDPAKIEPAIIVAKNKVEESMKALEELGGFNETTEFKDATMSLYKLFKEQLENEYSEQLQIYKLPEEEYTTEKQDRYNELQKLIDDKYTLVSNKFVAIQVEFSKRWNFTLE